MGRLILWLLLIVVAVLAAMFVYFGVTDAPVERTQVEQEIDPETLGL